jgi:hypothetical protein
MQGEYFASTRPARRRLIRIEPTATPIEKMARKSVATCSSAWNTFFTSGGN